MRRGGFLRDILDKSSKMLYNGITIFTEVRAQMDSTADGSTPYNTYIMRITGMVCAFADYALLRSSARPASTED